MLDYEILSTLLKDPDAPEVFKEHLIPEAVGHVNGSYGIYQLYKNAIKCYDVAGEVNAQTLGISLKEYPELYEKIGGDEGYKELVEMLDANPPGNPSALVKLANNHYKRTQTVKKLDKLKGVILSDQASDEDIENASQELQERIRHAKSRENITFRTGLDIAADSDDLFDTVPFIPTPFKSLNRALGYDKELGGVMRGNIYSVVANSGYGKSTFAKSMCNYWLDEGYKVLFVNFEEARDLWERVLMTQVTGHNVYQNKDMDSVTLSKISETFRAKMREWGTNFMVRHDPDSLYYEDLEDWLRDIYQNQEQDRPDIVVIDTIQSLFTKSGGKARWGEFEQIMVRLEKLAKDMDAVFILTAQQNSNALREGRSEINQSDIGGGVTIAQKSSVVMVLMPMQTDFGTESYEPDGWSPIMEVHMPKNRITGKQSVNNPPKVKYDDNQKLYLDYADSEERVDSARFDIDIELIDPTIGI